MQLDQHFAGQMGQLLGPDFPTDIAVAVSGGGDSMAMLHLAAGWARRFGVQLWPVTIDHGLRAESATEAQLVANEAGGLGLTHSTLRWSWDKQGNLQDAARKARLDLIDGWRGDCRHVLMAHTQNDQAETVLMRLLRGSGVDGLAGMSNLRHLPSGLHVVRPLLEVPRATLRHYAQVLKIPFVDDPSNDDTRYTRVRMRQMIAAESLDVAALAQSAVAMQRAREALDDLAASVEHQISRPAARSAGYAAFDRDGLASAPAETRLRLVARALMDIASAPYRPRLTALQDAVEKVMSGGKATLHGCLIWSKGAEVMICREFNAVKDLVTKTDVTWDGRWRFDGPHAPDLEIRALGEAGILEIDDWRALGVPRDVLMSAPAIWRDQVLVAAPNVGHKAGWTVQIVHGMARGTVPH